MDIFNHPHKIFIESHRGLNREFFENTLQAFNQAIIYDFDSIELDIWLTNDKIPVVIHGGSKGQLYDYVQNINKNITVNNLKLSEIKKLKTKKTNQEIPTLEEVLDLCKNKIFINIEIKDPNINETFEKLIYLLEKKEMINQIAISSFHHQYYDLVKIYNLNHENKIEFGFIYRDKKQKTFKPYRFDTYGCSMNIYQGDIEKNIVDNAHKNGIAVMAWFKMSEKETEKIYQKLFECGVDVIDCNEPKKLKEFRDKIYSKNL